jgi:hypothetical protein
LSLSKPEAVGRPNSGAGAPGTVLIDTNALENRTNDLDRAGVNFAATVFVSAHWQATF